MIPLIIPKCHKCQHPLMSHGATRNGKRECWVCKQWHGPCEPEETS